MTPSPQDRPSAQGRSTTAAGPQASERIPVESEPGEQGPQALDVATVRKIAGLARLALTADEVARLSCELTSILGFVSQLAALDTEAVEPLAHPLDRVNVFREDVCRPSLDRALALEGAPKHDGACFLVPAVLGED
jgi:aspartyl-tRNA(Asn)/glutamyl-tRNA(Gln) amidotransferase subunit C